MSWTLFPSWEKLDQRPGLSHPYFRSVKGSISRTLKSVTGLFFFWLNSRLTVLITLCLSLYSSSHVQMWELDHKEGWVPKNWCFWTVVLEKTLESPLDCKEIQPVHPKGNQSWIFIGKTDADADAPIFWPPDIKNWLIRKDPDAGKDWRQEEKGVTEDKMVVWYHQLNGHEFEQTLGDSEGQGSLACCSQWGRKELDMT